MKTTEEWRRLGKDDPLYAVAAHEGKRRAWKEADFYALGRSDWSDFERYWRRYEPDLRGTVVEIGSGAGRITAPLTGVFDRVIGIDVSPEQLALAGRAAPDADLRLVDATTIPLTDSSVDAVFTCHVLQHLENLDRVTDYLSEAVRVLRPGGTAMIHLLLAEAPPSWARRVRAETKLWLVRLLRANRGAYSRVRRYGPDQVRAAMQRGGFVDVELMEFNVSSNNAPHSFWFGRVV